MISRVTCSRADMSRRCSHCAKRWLERRLTPAASSSCREKPCGNRQDEPPRGDPGSGRILGDQLQRARLRNRLISDARAGSVPDYALLTLRLRSDPDGSGAASLVIRKIVAHEINEPRIRLSGYQETNAACYLARSAA